jgi:hypothetical protein
LEQNHHPIGIATIFTDVNEVDATYCHEEASSLPTPINNSHASITRIDSKDGSNDDNDIGDAIDNEDVSITSSVIDEDSQQATRKITKSTSAKNAVKRMVKSAKSTSVRNQRKSTKKVKLKSTKIVSPSRIAKLKHNHLKYDSTKKCFFTSYYDTKEKRYSKPLLQPDIDWIDDRNIRRAQCSPDTWVAPPIGDPFEKTPPCHLQTTVKTIYQQYNNPFCLTYSLASCFHYCGLHFAAQRLAAAATEFSVLHFDMQLKKLTEFMHNLCPLIGGCTIYNRRLRRHGKFIRRMTWQDLFTEIQPYPTLVVPVLPNGVMTHAFSVVDDLIFDSITNYALKLKQESVDWIFNGENVELYLAIKFNMKRSPDGHNIVETYNRPVKLNWIHESECNIWKYPEKSTKANRRRRRKHKNKGRIT